MHVRKCFIYTYDCLQDPQILLGGLNAALIDEDGNGYQKDMRGLASIVKDALRMITTKEILC